MFKGIIVAVMAIAASIGVAGSANAAPTDTAMIWTGLGSGTPTRDLRRLHRRHRRLRYDPGSHRHLRRDRDRHVQQGDRKPHHHLGVRPWTHRIVDDSTGVNNSAYAYTMTGTVTDNWVSGTYTITKTPIGGVSVTSGPQRSVGV